LAFLPDRFLEKYRKKAVNTMKKKIRRSGSLMKSTISDRWYQIRRQ